MSSTIRIPAPLRSLTNGADEVAVEGRNIREALTSLGSQHENINSKLLSDNGDLRDFVNIFLNGNEIRTMNGIDTALPEGSVLNIIPAVAGGLK